MKNTNQAKVSKGKKLAVGVGLGAIAATAVGTYLLVGSKNAAKNRKQVEIWSKKVTTEVNRRLKNLPELNEERYHRVIKEVAAEYERLKGLQATVKKVIRKKAK